MVVPARDTATVGLRDVLGRVRVKARYRLEQKQREQTNSVSINRKYFVYVSNEVCLLHTQCFRSRSNEEEEKRMLFKYAY